MLEDIMPHNVLKCWMSSGYYSFSGQIDYNELRSHRNITGTEPSKLFRGISRIQELDMIITSNPECDVINTYQSIRYQHDRPCSWSTSPDVAAGFAYHIEERQYGHPLAFGIVLCSEFDHNEMLIDLRKCGSREDEIIIDTVQPRTAKIHFMNQFGKETDSVSLADLRKVRDEYIRDMR